MMFNHKIVVIGGSAGAISALLELLALIPPDFSLPIVTALHLHPMQSSSYIKHLNKRCALSVKEAEDKEAIQNGQVYLAPPNYHLLIEIEKVFSLSIDAMVNAVRPSIDVLFESAVDAYAPRLIGVILTGANEDGAQGLHLIKQSGGLTIVQDPITAESPFMPKAALEATQVDYVLPVQEIGRLLIAQSNNST